MDTFAVVVQLYMSGFWAFGKWSDYTGLEKHGFAYATSTIGVPNGLVFTDSLLRIFTTFSGYFRVGIDV